MSVIVGNFLVRGFGFVCQFFQPCCCQIPVELQDHAQRLLGGIPIRAPRPVLLPVVVQPGA